MQVGAVLYLPSVVSLEVPERQAWSRTSGLLLLSASCTAALLLTYRGSQTLLFGRECYHFGKTV